MYVHFILLPVLLCDVFFETLGIKPLTSHRIPLHLRWGEGNTFQTWWLLTPQMGLWHSMKQLLVELGVVDESVSLREVLTWKNPFFYISKRSIFHWHVSLPEGSSWMLIEASRKSQIFFCGLWMLCLNSSCPKRDLYPMCLNGFAKNPKAFCGFNKKYIFFHVIETNQLAKCCVILMAFWELQPWQPRDRPLNLHSLHKNPRLEARFCQPVSMEGHWNDDHWVMKIPPVSGWSSAPKLKNRTLRSEGHALKAISYTWDQKFQDQCKRHEKSTLLEIHI